MRVLLIDDHPLVRHGIGLVLRVGLPTSRLGEAGDLAEARRLMDTERWDLIVLDLSLGQDSGLELLAELQARDSNARVLVLTAHREEEFAVRCLRLGAAGYLGKGCSPEELLAAARKVLSGGRYVSPSLAERLALLVGQDVGLAPHEALSARELQVLRLVALGHSAKQVADALGVSEKTIGTYRARIASKLGLSTNVELTRYALAHKLVD